jgi:23S rRNA (uracil1939-C5)-methyltransferase
MMIQDFADKEVILDIVDIDHKGRGIGYFRGIPVYVYFALPGEQVKVKLQPGKKKRELIGKLLEVLKPNPNRVQPFCKHFGSCGGCKLQQASYDYQLRLKRSLIKRELVSNELYDVEVSKVEPSETRFYRNKVELTYWPPRALGFKQPEAWDKIVDLEECYLVSPTLNDIIREAKRLLNEVSVSIYDRVLQKGSLRFLVYREAKFNDSNLLGIIVKDYTKDAEEYAKKLAERLSAQVENIVLGINPSLSDVAYAQTIVKIRGEDYYEERIGSIRYRVHLNSFFQPNVKIFAKILEKIKNSVSGEALVYDLYSGVGTISLYIADSVDRVIGIESEPSAVEQAKINAKLNDISNAEFHLGKVEKSLDLLSQLRKATVILDPPRSGLHPSVKKLLLRKLPPRIVYVSCNPRFQIRDLRAFLKYYQLEENKLLVYDMFPHTMHVESLAILEKKR